ncbi:intracellular protein transport protein USO1-like [Larimichthys crocea]|uniref:intracellular protein transport protein USO1-like n=1 Tax=Larimichthys crocea TaxID=215358 RepID=UPI000F5EDD5C|nr:intracellular protein transport protein USO1-like [Larimichthys crocea]
MSEDLYAKVDLTKKVRFQTAEKEDTNADNNGNIDNVTIYDNYCAEGSTPPKSPDNGTDDQQQTTSVNVSSGQRNLFKAAAVFLGLLCLVLLAAVIVLVVLWIQDKNNWRVSNEKLTLKTSELEAMNNNLTNETDKLQTSYRESKNLNHNLTLKISELEAMINNLTNETDRLQTSYRESKSLNHNLTLKISELEAMNNNLTNETDKLQTSYRESKSLNHNLTLKISELEAMNNNLTNETDKLQTSYRESKSLNDNLILKIRELDAMINNLISERDQLKSFILGELGWVYFSGSLYYIFLKKKDLATSRDDCQQRGGRPGDYQQQRRTVDLIPRAKPRQLGARALWDSRQKHWRVSNEKLTLKTSELEAMNNNLTNETDKHRQVIVNRKPQSQPDPEDKRVRGHDQQPHQ